MAFAYDHQQVGYALEAGEEAVRDAVFNLVDALETHGALKFFTNSDARKKQLISLATKTALLSILTAEECSVDDVLFRQHVVREAA